MIRLRTTALTLVLTLGAVLPASAQTTLRYKFKEGEKLTYVMDQKMKMATKVMGNAVDMNMNQSSEMTWTVLGVDSAGVAKINIKFGKVKMTMDGPMGKVEVDSANANEPDDPLGKVLFGVIKGLAALEITGKFSPRGEFSDVEMPEKVVKQLQGLPGADFMGEMFTPEGLKRMMSQSALVLPQDGVDKGAKWKNSFNMKLPFGKIGTEINYVYDGPTSKDGRNVDKINLDPKMTIEADPNAPFAMKLKTQENSGSAYFDNAAGKLVNVTMNQTMDMEVEVMGQTITQRLVQNVVTRLVETK